MIEFVAEKCTGCRSCEQVCPAGCIELVKDEEGFIYPKVNSDKCIKCGKCLKRCHAMVENKEELLDEPKKRTVVYGWTKNTELHKNSSSGGAFSELVQLFAGRDDIVIGAAFTEDFRYVHHVVCSGGDYSALRKSKYVFSDTEKTYSQCREYLEKGKKVVFSGTPCQIGGLYSFLGKHYDNLLTIDFICHGTPSIDLLNAHLDWISGGKKITNVDFRSKALGWRKYCLKVELDGGKYLRSIDEDYYLCSFMKCSMLRKCCSDCRYSDGNHVSDITIADFWGIRQYCPEYTEDKGVSLIVFNNLKHTDMIEKLSNTMELKEVSEEGYKYIYKTHSNYDAGSRKQFFEEYQRNGWSSLAKKYYKGRTKRKIKRFLKKLSGAK